MSAVIPIAAAALTTAFATTAATALGGGLLATAFAQIAAGVALSAIARATQSRPKANRGLTVSLQFGEVNSQTRILGTFVTAGELLYHGSCRDSPGGTPNAHYVQVIELADWPARAKRFWINGEWVTLRTAEPHPDFGWPVEGYQEKGMDFLWVKFYDGTQTQADPFLIDAFGNDDDRPWQADMIGRGVPYVIVTARHQLELHPGRPVVRVELEDWGFYDRRKDSTNGGTGPQRAGDWRTWQPTRNPVVMIEGVLRGFHDPITDKFLWGGQGIGDYDLPPSVWMAAANECDRLIDWEEDGIAGQEEQYQAGFEVRINDDEPADVIDELLKTCQGLIAEAAGEWTVRAGPPGLPIYAFTDDDIVTTESETFDPFPAIDGSYNGVSASYPEPREGYATKPAPTRESAAYKAADLGKTNVATMSFSACPYPRQVQRLQKSALLDARRFRRHQPIVLPPEARALGPLDEVTFTSTRYGYVSKDWSLPLVEDLENGCVAVGLQERDPNDYDWQPGDLLPSPVGYTRRPPKPIQTADFSVEPATIADELGRPRRPAIRLNWTVRDNVTSIRYRVRLFGGAQIPGDSEASKPDGGTSTFTLAIGGRPVAIAGKRLSYSIFEDETAGTALIHGGWMLPNTRYEVQAIYAPIAGRKWSAWLPVTTPDTRLSAEEFDDLVNERIDNAEANANDAADQARNALDKANEVEATVRGISSDTLDDLKEIADSLQGLDTGTIQQLHGVAVAGLRRGWSKDPTFEAWTGGGLTYWSMIGQAYASKSTEGFYPSSLQFTAPFGTAALRVFASSDVADQLPGADPKQEYVVVGIMMRALAGSVAGGTLRAEWRAVGSTTWTRGKAFGQTAPSGVWSDWGITEVDPTRLVSRAIIFQRPIANPEAVRIVLQVRGTDTTAAVTVRIDYLDIRAADDAEVKAFLANGYADAAIENFSATLVGPDGALAAMQTTLRTEFGDADASLNSSLVSVSNNVEALAGRIDIAEARFGGNNLVTNPVFVDGVRGAGATPNYWMYWGSLFSVVQKGSGGGSAVAEAPTRYMGRIAASTDLQEALGVLNAPVKPGQTLALALQAAGGASSGSINFQIGLRARFRDGDGAFISNATRLLTITGTSWVSSEFGLVTVPQGAADMQVWLTRPAGGTSTPALFTNVESRIVDDVAYAKAVSATSTASDAETAVATMQNKVEAHFDDFDAFVEQTASAVAQAERSYSAYVIRNVAGGGTAEFKLVSWDDETGVGEAIVLDADNIIARGTLSAESLVITDLGHNKVPDDQLQSKNAWSGASDGFTIIKQTTNTSADSVGEMRWVRPASGNTGVVYSIGSPFPVRPGQRLRCAFQVCSLASDGTYSVTVRLRYGGKDGAFVQHQIIATVSGTGFPMRNLSADLVVPAGCFQAAWRWDVDRAASSANVRFFSPSVISNEDASVLITPDGAFFETLGAKELWVRNANIVNLTIKGEKIGPAEISNIAAGIRTTDLEVTSDDTWTTIVSASVTKTAAEVMFAFAQCVISQLPVYQWTTGGIGGSVTNGIVRYRVVRGSTTIWSGTSIRPVWIDTESVSGTFTYSLQARTERGTGDGSFVSKNQNLEVDEAVIAVQQFKK